MHIKYLPFLLLSVLLLSGCDPDYESTSNECAANASASVFLRVEDFEVLSGEDEYLLYLQDILEAMQPDPVEPALPADEQAALDAIQAIINSLLDYQMSAGSVTGATNPLDFLEALISTTDNEQVIELFNSAKRQVQKGIDDDDDFCSYRNDNIVVEKNDLSETLFAEYQLSYDPFSRIVQQSVVITRVAEDLGDTLSRTVAPYVGFYQAAPNEFKVSGFTQPLLRQAIINSDDSSESLIIDDGFDNDIGAIVYNQVNSYCNPVAGETNPSYYAKCDDGVPTRTVQKTACEADLTDQGPDFGNLIDETDRIEERFFDLVPGNSALSGLKRLRVEIDYTDQTETMVKVFVSKHSENGAVYDADGTTIIYDPTDCEKQAILDDLFEQGDGSGVSLTLIPDPGFDESFELDGEGNVVNDANGDPVIIEPTPIIIFKGTTLLSRL